MSRIWRGKRGKKVDTVDYDSGHERMRWNEWLVTERDQLNIVGYSAPFFLPYRLSQLQNSKYSRFYYHQLRAAILMEMYHFRFDTTGTRHTNKPSTQTRIIVKAIFRSLSPSYPLHIDSILLQTTSVEADQSKLVPKPVYDATHHRDLPT